MARDISEYFARRAEEELKLAEAAVHPVVKRTHERFAAFYREWLRPREQDVQSPTGS